MYILLAVLSWVQRLLQENIYLSKHLNHVVTLNNCSIHVNVLPLRTASLILEI